MLAVLPAGPSRPSACEERHGRGKPAAAGALRDGARAGGVRDPGGSGAPHAEGDLRRAGLQYGAIWEVDRARNVLRCVAIWHPPAAQFEPFAAATREARMAPGVGLPGRVWTSREPAWIHDVTRDTNFPRAPFAAQSGLHSAFGLPIAQGTSVLGVMEFFSRDILEPTSDLLAMMNTIASQIALYVQRKWAAEELDRFFRLSLDL